MLKPDQARRLREAREALTEATEAYEDAIVVAWKKGASLRDIGAEVGTTHVVISRLLERVGVRKKWRSLADANRELERREALDREARDE